MSRGDFYPMVDALGAELMYLGSDKVAGVFQVELVGKFFREE